MKKEATKKQEKQFDDYVHYLSKDPVCIMKKKGSPHRVEFHQDLRDDWFFYCITRSNKKADISHASMIIRKDLPGWITYHQSMGWAIEKELTINITE